MPTLIRQKRMQKKNYQENKQKTTVKDVLQLQEKKKAKCYQTVVRLGTYTAKVSIYNSLKACEGTMFFLPLPMAKTLDTLNHVKYSSQAITYALPNPELYIILNGKPTKQKIVWRSLVNVKDVKAAVEKLKEINFLCCTMRGRIKAKSVLLSTYSAHFTPKSVPITCKSSRRLACYVNCQTKFGSEVNCLT